MSRIDLVEDYAIRQLRNSVKESLQSHGEECLLLQMFHVVPDAQDVPRCHCFDDVYNQGSKFDCPDCYGTTLQGGVKKAARAWALFSDAQGVESQSKRGVWTPDHRRVQTEALPVLLEHDFIIRVLEWDRHRRPVDIEGIYSVDLVTNVSLRTGGVYGQTKADAVGQSADVIRLQEGQHPIYKFPALSQVFPRMDGLVR